MKALETLLEKTELWADEHSERVFVLKSLLLLGFFLTLRIYFKDAWKIAIFLFPIYLIFWTWLESSVNGNGFFDTLKTYITFIDAPKITKKDKIKKIAFVTWGLVVTNIIIFAFENEYFDFCRANLIFLPREPNYLNIPLSLFTSIFLHSGVMHIFYNMIFLGVIGPYVERRIGSYKFLYYYIFTGVIANIFGLVFYSIDPKDIFHGLGASGAISGIMGIYVVRCYYEKMQIPFSTLGIFNFNLRLNAFVVMGIFFAVDLSNGLRQIVGNSNSNTGHWVHVGGFLAGILFAYTMKLPREAIEERHRNIISEIVEDGHFSYEKFNSLGGMKAVEKSAKITLEIRESIDALIALARVKSCFDTIAVGSAKNKVGEGSEYFEKVLPMMIEAGHEDTLKIFLEYFRQYGQIFEPEKQWLITFELYKKGEYFFARRTAEACIQKFNNMSFEIKEKFLYYICLCSEKDENIDKEMIIFAYNEFLQAFPDTSRSQVIREKLKLLDKIEDKNETIFIGPEIEIPKKINYHYFVWLILGIPLFIGLEFLTAWGILTILEIPTKESNLILIFAYINGILIYLASKYGFSRKFSFLTPARNPLNIGAGINFVSFCSFAISFYDVDENYWINLIITLAISEFARNLGTKKYLEKIYKNE